MKVLKPSDFFCGLSLEMIWKAFKLMPVRTIMALVLYYVMASFMFVIYYVTLIPRLINNAVGTFAEWSL